MRPFLFVCCCFIFCCCFNYIQFHLIHASTSAAAGNDATCCERKSPCHSSQTFTDIHVLRLRRRQTHARRRVQKIAWIHPSWQRWKICHSPRRSVRTGWNYKFVSGSTPEASHVKSKSESPHWIFLLLKMTQAAAPIIPKFGLYLLIFTGLIHQRRVHLWFTGLEQYWENWLSQLGDKRP